MGEQTCPNCREKFKTLSDRKYYECPNCGLEIADRTIDDPYQPKPAPSNSLLEKLRNVAKKA